jgi:hypothetical protein
MRSNRYIFQQQQDRHEVGVRTGWRQGHWNV